jgi:hypothetical protein
MYNEIGPPKCSYLRIGRGAFWWPPPPRGSCLNSVFFVELGSYDSDDLSWEENKRARNSMLY